MTSESIFSSLNRWARDNHSLRLFFGRRFGGQVSLRSGCRNAADTAPLVGDQGLIVAEIDRRMSLVFEIAAQVVANLQRADRMRQRVLDVVFDRGAAL